MAKLYFRYATMNSGKSLDLLRIAHNYREQGKSVLLFTPALDDRYAVGQITSRMGVAEEAIPVPTVFDFLRYIRTEVSTRPDVVMVDEAHFLTRYSILALAGVVDELDIPVMCYGLKSDFQGKLFDGSATLLSHADSITEIKNVCWYCDRKAIMNMRVDEHGNKVMAGAQVDVGGNDKYIAVCRKHFYDPPYRS